MFEDLPLTVGADSEEGAGSGAQVGAGLTAFTLREPVAEKADVVLEPHCAQLGERPLGRVVERPPRGCRAPRGSRLVPGWSAAGSRRRCEWRVRRGARFSRIVVRAGVGPGRGRPRLR